MRLRAGFRTNGESCASRGAAGVTRPGVGIGEEAVTAAAPVDGWAEAGPSRLEPRRERNGGGPTGERDSRLAGPVVLQTLASWTGCLRRGRPGRIPTRTWPGSFGRDLAEMPQGSAAMGTGKRLCGVLVAAGFVQSLTLALFRDEP